MAAIPDYGAVAAQLPVVTGSSCYILLLSNQLHQTNDQRVVTGCDKFIG